MTYEQLTTIILDAGFRPVPYSGRFMFGQQCVGVIVRDEQSALADIIEECGLVEIAAEVIRLMKTDDMARDVILYWPGVDWCGEDEDEDEDDENEVA